MLKKALRVLVVFMWLERMNEWTSSPKEWSRGGLHNHRINSKHGYKKRIFVYHNYMIVVNGNGFEQDQTCEKQHWNRRWTTLSWVYFFRKMEETIRFGTLIQWTSPTYIKWFNFDLFRLWTSST